MPSAISEIIDRFEGAQLLQPRSYPPDHVLVAIALENCTALPETPPVDGIGG